MVLVGVVLKDLLGGTTGCINFIQVVVFSKVETGDDGGL